MWLIPESNAREVLNLAAVTLPIIALAYLASDKEQFHVANAQVQIEYLPDPKGHWQLAARRLDAVFGLIFVSATVAGFVIAILGLLARKIHPWMLAGVLIPLATALDLIMWGVANHLAHDIERSTPKAGPENWPKSGPSERAATVELNLGLFVVVLFQYVGPIAIIAMAVIIMDQVAIH